MKQVANRLIKKHVLEQEDEEENEQEFQIFLEKVRSNGNDLNFPPFFVQSTNLKKGIVSCQAVKIRDKYEFIFISSSFCQFILFLFLF